MKQLLIAFLLIAIVPPPARGERIGGFDVVLHEVCGEGGADLTDAGAPPQTSSWCNLGGPPDTVGGGIYAVDRTQPGSLGAEAVAFGGSALTVGSAGSLFIRIEIWTAYLPSAFPGGDNPGGMAEGHFTSVLEFIMPYADIPAPYLFLIDQDPPFAGSANVLVENVTQSLTILDLDAHVGNVDDNYLPGAAGDLIRITSTMEGSGSMGPGSYKEYQALFQMVVWIPEPSTLWALVVATLTLVGRRRSSTCKLETGRGG